MPPESLPWDRRDYYKKHDRSSSDPRLGTGNYSGGGGGGPHRWRDQNHHPHAPPYPPPYHHQSRHQQQQQQRWYPDVRSSRPITPGHGKQGNWHVYSDESSHGFSPFGSRYSDRNFEDENPRLFSSRGEERYVRNIREGRMSYSQKEWKGPSWEPAASPSGPGRSIPEINNQKYLKSTQTSHNFSRSRSIDSSPRPPYSADPANKSQVLIKEYNDNNVRTADGPASTSQTVDKDFEKENGMGSMDWRHMKLTRPCSMSARSSGFSNSNSSKSIAVSSIETMTEAQPKNIAPHQSPPPAAAAACAVSKESSPSDESGSRKKPRLGWGEGLAKFEKKKVDGPEDCPIQNGLVVSVNDTEMVESHAVCLHDKSPKVAILPGYTSPTTPSSVGCSSSPGFEEKESVKVVNVSHSTSNLSCSPSIVAQTHHEAPALSLENLEHSSMANLTSLISDLVQSNDPNSVDSGYIQASSMNKLFVLKDDLSKALELAQIELDSHESQLKSLKADPISFILHPAVSSSIPEDWRLKPCTDQATPFNFTLKPAPSQIVSSEDMIVETTQEDENAVLKDDDVDSPGSTTSKFVEMLPVEDVLHSQPTECSDGIPVLDEKCPENGVRSEDNAGNVDNYELVVNNGSQELVLDGNLCRDTYDAYVSVMSGNKDCCNRVVEQLNKLLPGKQCQVDVMAAGITSLHSDLSTVKERYLNRRRLLQFKEKVTTLKFKAFQHFWKEGRPISVRKLRMKSHKKLDLSQSAHKKNRSSIRCRNSFSAGSLQAVPADEVLDYVNALLSEMPSKSYRSTLKMPALILDKSMKMSRFISNNGLVEDPCAVEKERSIVNQWASEERETFISKLATFGKDFKKIASFLDNRTIADCVEFYYKNHKSECFQKARDFMKQRKPQSTTYLVGSGKRWDRETNAASLDMLGVASAIAANNDGSIEIQQKCKSRIVLGASSSYRTSKADNDGSVQRSESPDMYSNDRETVAADVLAGICGSISSEAMSSCITSSFDHGDGNQDKRCQRVNSSKKRPLTIEVTQNVDGECSDESCGELDHSDWTDEEKSTFIQAVVSYGKDFVMISKSVRTRSRDQCKVFFGKARKCLGLDQMIVSGPGNGGEVEGGGSDIDDACDVENHLVICNDSSKCKTENDLVQDLKPDCGIEENSGHCLLESVAEEPELVNSPSLVDLPLRDSLMEDKEQNGTDSPHVNMQEPGTVIEPSNTKILPVEQESGCSLHNESNKDSIDVSDSQEKLMVLSPGNNLATAKIESGVSKSNEVTAMECAVSEIKPDNVGQLSIQSDELVLYKTKSDIESTPRGTPSDIPLQQNGHSTTLFSVPIEYQRTTNSIMGNDKHSQNIDQHRRSGYTLSDPVDSFHILRGQPVSLKETNGDSFIRPVPLQNVNRRDGTSFSDFSIQKCSRPESKSLGHPFQSYELSRHNPRPKSAPSSNTDNPSRNGNVKLFGKFLVPSPQQIVDSRAVHENGCHLKLNGGQNMNLSSRGNRMHAGFSSHLRDSERIYNKFPGAFSNYPLQQLDQAQSHGGTIYDSFLRNNRGETQHNFTPQEVLLAQVQRFNAMQVQSGRGMIGRSGVVSDPVAAIRRHYANAEPYNIIREEDLGR